MQVQLQCATWEYTQVQIKCNYTTVAKLMYATDKDADTKWPNESTAMQHISGCKQQWKWRLEQPREQWPDPSATAWGTTTSATAWVQLDMQTATNQSAWTQ